MVIVVDFDIIYIDCIQSFYSYNQLSISFQIWKLSSSYLSCTYSKNDCCRLTLLQLYNSPLQTNIEWGYCLSFIGCIPYIQSTIVSLWNPIQQFCKLSLTQIWVFINGYIWKYYIHLKLAIIFNSPSIRSPVSNFLKCFWTKRMYISSMPKNSPNSTHFGNVDFNWGKTENWWKCDED